MRFIIPLFAILFCFKLSMASEVENLVHKEELCVPNNKNWTHSTGCSENLSIEKLESDQYLKILESDQYVYLKEEEESNVTQKIFNRKR